MSKQKKSAGTDTLSELDAMDRPSQEAYEALRVRLNAANTVAELLAVVNDEFKAETARLPEAAKRALRDTYAIVLADVRHNKKMDELSGKVVVITDPPEFPPPSPRFPDSHYCVIKGTIEATGEPFVCRSSAVRVTRHFNDSKLDSYPQHITFYQESAASMLARNAKPGTTAMWLVKKETAPRTRTNADDPGF